MKTPVSINKGNACRFEIREENKSKGAFLQFEKLIEVRVHAWAQAKQPLVKLVKCGAMRDL